jgi:hypothetical protein
MKSELIISILICFLFSSCKQSTSDNTNEVDCNDIKVSNLLSLINEPIDEIQRKHNFLSCFKQKKMTLTDETGSISSSWKGVSFYDKKGEEMFGVESSWVSPDSVKRVFIYSQSIKETYINQSFKAIVNEIDTNRLNEFPDGDLGLINRKDERINYLMDVSNNFLLTVGVSSKDIPDTLKVSYLMLISLE